METLFGVEKISRKVKLPNKKHRKTLTNHLDLDTLVVWQTRNHKEQKQYLV